MSDLLRRQAALEKTLAKFRRKAFSWGESDCIKLARFHLVAMGHRPPKVPAYRTALGAKRALQKANFSTLLDLFDSLLPRIPPSNRLPGDIVIMRGEEDGLEAVTISVSEKVLGWHPDAQTLVPLTPLEILGVWRA